MKKVYEYLYGKGMGLTDDSPIPKDGNLMVLAINAMRDKGDWIKYVFYVSTHYYSNSCFFFEDITFSMFGDPAKFFELMEEWIEKVEKNEKAD